MQLALSRVVSVNKFCLIEWENTLHGGELALRILPSGGFDKFSIAPSF
jgi:hypothetical protein